MSAQRIFALLIAATFALGACKKEEAKEESSEKAAKKDDDDDDKGGKKKKKKSKDDDDTSEDKSDDDGKKKKKKGGTCPTTFSELPDAKSADEQTCACEEEHMGGPVWGTEIFTEDSSPCAAAVHAGVIKKSGGTITMKHTKGCDVYIGSTKNGVTSHGWDKFGGSFYFPDKGDGKCKKSDACPNTFAEIKDKDEDTEVTCKCAASPTGSVWGSDIYTQDSSICRAAVHNGVITADEGGSVTAKAAPGCKSYTASTANGVTTSSWGEYQTSFYFPSKGDGICKVPKVVTATKFKAGDAVSILWNGAWYPGSILAVAAGPKYRVHYAGYAASWDEWVSESRVKAKGGALAAPSTTTTTTASATTAPLAGTTAYSMGEAVNILWNGSWYPGKIIGVDGGKYKVHYDGYNASWDEWVTSARLKKK
jgi:hypothetical protein